LSEYIYPVTEAIRAQYKAQGFFITPVLFDEAELIDMREAVNAIWAEQITASVNENEMRQRLARERPFIADLHLKHPVCATFLKHPALLGLARQMIGPDVDVAYNQAVLKPPTGEIPNSFAWHQDSFYACRHADDENYRSPEWSEPIMTRAVQTFQGWVALTSTTEANGTLHVLPGGHKNGFLKHEELEETRELAADPDTSREIAVELQPGQMLVFSGMLPHCSGPNRTDETRMVYQFCYGVPGTRAEAKVYPVVRQDVVV
jgi:ectoine hydroxylase-related dioxygenase (phytanoyl-CoA dioxygenase family)